MRQKVTRYPGKDLTVITWTGRTETKPSQKDIFKEMLFNLTEKYYFEMRLGKVEYLTQVNLAVKEFRGFAQ